MDNVESTTGYVSGLIGRLTELHAQYYAEHWRFGHFFEAKVATELSNFISHYNEARDCIWSLSGNGQIEGSITIDGSSHIKIWHTFAGLSCRIPSRGKGLGII